MKRHHRKAGAEAERIHKHMVTLALSRPALGGKREPKERTFDRYLESIGEQERGIDDDNDMQLDRRIGSIPIDLEA